MTNHEIADVLDDVKRMLIYGCSNHGCVIDPLKRMGTNDTCRCRKYIAEHLLAMAIETEKMTIIHPD